MHDTETGLQTHFVHDSMTDVHRLYRGNPELDNS